MDSPKTMNTSSRRRFLHKTTLLTAGIAAATPTIGLGDTPTEASLRSEDAKLAGVLRSYGRAQELQEDGFRRVRTGAKTRRLPVTRVTVEVRDQQAFCRSFEKMTHLSERVNVEGNTIQFSRGGKFYVVENLLS